AREVALQCVEAGLEDVGADTVHQILCHGFVALELGRPLGEGAVAVRDWRQSQRGYVVGERHGAFQDRVGAEEIVVGKTQQFLPNAVSILEAEVPYTADSIRGLAVLNPAFADPGVPARHAVEVPNPLPDLFGGSVDDARHENTRHRST